MIFLWRVPYFIFRQRSWSLASGFVNALAALFGSWKYNFLVAAGFLLSVGAVLFSDRTAVMALGVAVLVSLLSGSSKRSLSWLPKIRTNICATEDAMKGVAYENLTHEQAEKWKGNLQTSIILSRLCLFVARRLRDYGRSRLTKVASVFISLMMFAETVVVFTFVNYGLFRIDPAMFRVAQEGVGLFDFFYYSFNRIVFCSVNEIAPASMLAKSSFVAEAACALFLVAIFVSLLFSTRSETQAEELNRSIEVITLEGRKMEQMILAEYQFNSVEAALAALQQVKAGMLGFIYKLSENIDDK